MSYFCEPTPLLLYLNLLFLCSLHMDLCFLLISQSCFILPVSPWCLLSYAILIHGSSLIQPELSSTSCSTVLPLNHGKTALGQLNCQLLPFSYLSPTWKTTLTSPLSPSSFESSMLTEYLSVFPPSSSAPIGYLKFSSQLLWILNKYHCPLLHRENRSQMKALSTPSSKTITHTHTPLSLSPWLKIGEILLTVIY